MNLLAHAYLGRDLTLESNAFNVLWDFVSRDYLQDSRNVVLLGRQRHILIDKMADTQPWFVRSRKLFSAERQKAAPILIDIFADYLLIQQWDQFAQADAEDHIGEFLKDLCEGAASEGGKVLYMAEIIRDQRWFDDYRSVEGLGRILDRVARRATPRLAGLLTGAEEELRRREEEIQEGFPDFMKTLDQELRGQ
jgi:acyl carrier protein phosphodiesterase